MQFLSHLIKWFIQSSLKFITNLFYTCMYVTYIQSYYEPLLVNVTQTIRSHDNWIKSFSPNHENSFCVHSTADRFDRILTKHHCWCLDLSILIPHLQDLNWRENWKTYKITYITHSLANIWNSKPCAGNYLGNFLINITIDGYQTRIPQKRSKTLF